MIIPASHKIKKDDLAGKVVIVTAGIKKRYTRGIILNSDRISDWLKRKKVRVKKYPVITAKITRKM